MSEIKVPFGDLKLSYQNQRTALDAAIQSVLNRGWFVLGEAGRKFESEFATYCGCKYAMGVGSGTEAIHLALLACGLEPGDEVVTVSNTCVPTLSAISFAGGVPVLVDVDPATYTMDPTRIEERLTSRTRFLLPVHLYGQCADMDPILEIARRHGLKVVEDCAQAHGALYKGRHAGTMGDAGAYSFYPSKNLGAYGDAGMVLTSNAEIAERVRMMRNYGEKQRYRHAIKGFNSRLDEMQAAILSIRLPNLDDTNNRRRTIAIRYVEAFRSLKWMTLPVEARDRHHIYHLFVVRVPQREAFQQHLANCGVSALIHYPVPIHRQEAYSECMVQSRYLTWTDAQASEIISLPLFPEMTEEQVDTVIKSVMSWNPK